MRNKYIEKGRTIVITFILILVGLFVCSGEQVMAGNAKKITIFKASSDSNVKVKNYNVNVQKYDITGDSRNDKITIKAQMRYSGGKSKVTVSINGKTAYSYSSQFLSDIVIDYICLENKKSYLFFNVYDTRSNLGDAQFLLLYQSGKLKKAVDFTKYYCFKSAEILKVYGNKIDVKIFVSPRSLSNSSVQHTYIYKNGKLIRSGNIGEIIYTCGTHPSGYGTLRNDYTLYTTAAGNKVKEKLKAGTKAAAQKVYLKNNKLSRIQIRTADGKTGWIKAVEQYGEKNLVFREAMYAG